MTIRFAFGELPQSFTDEQAEFLRDALTQIQIALESARDFDPDVLQPVKQADGMLRYSPGGYDFDDGPGFYGRIAGAWQRFSAGAERLLGVYDQVLDRTSDNNPLICADQPPIQSGDYYICSKDGVCNTSCPDIAGQLAGIGDRILSDGSTWTLIPVSAAYLSSQVDDTALGVITFSVGAQSQTVPVAPNDLTRKSYVDAEITAHEMLQTDPDDVHGGKSYTDQQDGIHAALQAEPDDVHGTKAYTDQEIADLAQASLTAFSFAAYGGIQVDTPAAFPSLGGGWQIIDVFDEIIPAVPRGVTPNLTNSTMSWQLDGVYSVTVAGTFEHNSSNQGRTTYIRFWDVTDGVEVGIPAVIATGRNAEATQINFPMLFELTEDLKNHEIRIEIGGGDTYTSVIFDYLIFSSFAVSEWREPFNE